MSFEAPVRDDPRSGRRGARIGLLLAILLSHIYATYFAQRPIYNWDMVAYVAVALIDAGEPAETVHRKTYDIVAASLPPDRFAELTQSNARRVAVAADAARFAAQLPFYTVKPVYPAVMSLLYRAGMYPVTASVAVSAAGYAGICLLLYVWTARWLRPLVAVPVAALLSLCPYLTPIAQLSTPDALSVLDRARQIAKGAPLVDEAGLLRSGTTVAYELHEPALLWQKSLLPRDAMVR
jgi:hypothetical protein